LLFAKHIGGSCEPRVHPKFYGVMLALTFEPIRSEMGVAKIVWPKDRVRPMPSALAGSLSRN